jgi:DNA-directed RNA polymerase specialized sigma24 family protein
MAVWFASSRTYPMPDTLASAKSERERVDTLSNDIDELDGSELGLAEIDVLQLHPMSRAETCRSLGWSAEKYRKVAQRARARLRGLIDSEGQPQQEPSI